MHEAAHFTPATTMHNLPQVFGGGEARDAPIVVKPGSCYRLSSRNRLGRPGRDRPTLLNDVACRSSRHWRQSITSNPSLPTMKRCPDVARNLRVWSLRRWSGLCNSGIACCSAVRVPRGDPVAGILVEQEKYGACAMEQVPEVGSMSHRNRRTDTVEMPRMARTGGSGYGRA
jgi:hypothetical protein